MNIIVIILLFGLFMVIFPLHFMLIDAKGTNPTVDRVETDGKHTYTYYNPGKVPVDQTMNISFAVIGIGLLGLGSFKILGKMINNEF